MTKGKAKKTKRRIAWGRYLLFFFIAAWMFFLGVMVGRGTAPVRFDIQALQKELAELRDATVKEERAAMESALRGDDEQAAFGFYEELEKEGPDTTGSISINSGPSDASIPRNGSVDSATVPHKKRAAIMAKKETARRETIPGSTPHQEKKKNPATAKLTIQVASLKDAAAAQQVVAKLKKDGYPAYLSKSNATEQGAWFRVRVGKYDNRQQAEADMDRLIKAQLKPIIVRDRP